MGDQIDALFLRFGDGILHGLLVQQTVLHQSLGKAAQGHATGAANRRNCVVIHGLTVNPMPLLQLLSVAGQSNCQIICDGRTLAPSAS